MAEPEVANKQTEQAPAGSKRRWALVLRAVIYGGLLALFAVIGLTLFYPMKDPEAVRRVAQIKPNPAPAATQTSKAADENTPAIGQPLFAPKKSNPDPSHMTLDEIQNQIRAIEQMSISDPCKDTTRQISKLAQELQSRVWEIQSSPTSADDKLKAYRRISRLYYELMQREEEHYVRHGRWASAAELCAMQGERMKAIYYWRRAGGSDGRIKAVLAPLGYFPSWKLYPVTLPEEDAGAMQFFILPPNEVPYKLWQQWRAEDGMK